MVFFILEASSGYCQAKVNEANKTITVFTFRHGPCSFFACHSVLRTQQNISTRNKCYPICNEVVIFVSESQRHLHILAFHKRDRHKSAQGVDLVME